MTNAVGTENLEAMEAAANYNAALLSFAHWAVRRGEDGIDFGAGVGTFAVSMTRSARNVVCIEPDATCREELRSLGLTVYAALDDAPAGSFDGAWSFNVLEHIDDDACALRALHRVLRPYGRLVLYVPAFPILFSAMDVHVGHRRRYRRSALVSLCERTGFRVERAQYVDCLGFVAALLFRLLRRNGRLNADTVRIYDRIVFPLSQRLDPIFCRIFGKNLLIEARRH